jgi:hypothetical protein
MLGLLEDRDRSLGVLLAQIEQCSTRTQPNVTVILTLLWLPFGKFFHIFQRPAQIGVC